MMKYEQTEKTFKLKTFGWIPLKTFNAEVEKYKTLKEGKLKNDVSWSHGFTHLKRADNGEYLGFCGTYYFEKHAVEVVQK
jgi:hypothetical protein